MVRPFEGRGFEQKKCCVQRKRCKISLSTATLQDRAIRPRAMQFFVEALQSDVSDVQQGTSAQGVRLGAMAGTVDQVQRLPTGIGLRPQPPADGSHPFGMAES